MFVDGLVHIWLVVVGFVSWSCVVQLYVCRVRSVFVFFFFFKQKTAYEVRISYWSSDVCSSDLGRLQSAAVITGRTRIGPGAVRADLHGLEHAIVAADGSAAGTERHQMHHRNRHHPAFDDRVEEIGRASCRERVCQYV